MKRSLFAAALLVAATTAGGANAETGGCLKYGAGGAVAGHFVGRGHAALGAAGGCAVGAYKRHEARKAAVANERGTTDPNLHQ